MLHKADILIGKRAAEEILRLFPTIGKASVATGINKRIISDWYNNGNCPSGFSMQQLYYAGADIIYILTGNRSKEVVKIG